MSQTLATLNTASNATGDYWLTTTQSWYPATYWPAYWPNTFYYHSTVSRDDGEKALKIAKALLDAKLIRAESAKQFINLIDIILKELKAAA